MGNVKQNIGTLELNVTADSSSGETLYRMVAAHIKASHQPFNDNTAKDDLVEVTVLVRNRKHQLAIKAGVKELGAVNTGYGGREISLNGFSRYAPQSRYCVDMSLGLYVEDAEFIKLAPKLPTIKTEEVQMFRKHVVSAATLGEINPITLELAVKKLAAGNSKLQIIEKKDVVYLVTEGADPVELDGPRFKAMVETVLVGKTMDEIRANANLAQLVNSLNVIESITLTRKEAKLEDIIGG